MKTRLLFSILPLLLWLLPLTSHANLYQLPRTEVVPIKDSITDRQYELYIKLPENYAKNPAQTYPVIYFTDAVWHIEILSASTAFLMEDVILVGISWQKDIDKALLEEHGEHVSRFRDYSFRKSSKPEIQAKYQLGQAKKHLAFIRNDVFKYVESHYRTKPQERTYFGYSAGASFGAYALLSEPGTFKNYILGSPDLQGDMPILTKLIEHRKNDNKQQAEALSSQIFISYGKAEKELAVEADNFITLLKSNPHKGMSLTHSVIEGTHQTAFPRTGVESINWLANLQANKDKS